MLLHKRVQVLQFCAERWNIDAFFSGVERRRVEATADSAVLNGKNAEATNEPWKSLHIDSDLDRAVDSVSVNKTESIAFIRIDNKFLPKQCNPYFTCFRSFSVVS